MRPAQITALALAFLAGFSAWILPHAAQDGGELEEYMTGLNWPVALAFAPDGRIFYAERFTGAIRIIQNRALLPQPFYTLENTAAGGEQGLLGLALDPAFPAGPYVYAYHTFDDPANGIVYNRIVRIRASGNAGTFDRVVLDRIPAAGVHNGGILAFGPDGKLYATDGDATNTAAAQDLSALNGKIMRINPDGSVPSDNPFVGDP
ncbi:MAG: PQQ-dependent sugar dehydrogenase, partial [Euryarchaeota archaeon]|nr:PQQ-dependent sugar dehydrogenase [Euryarchaeota archaeon]